MKHFSSAKTRSLLPVSFAAAVILALNGCERQADGKTVGQSVDSGIAKTEQAARDAGNAIKDASRNVQASAGQAGTAMSEKIDDVSITARVLSGLARDPDLSAIKIDVDTREGVVTLNGPAPSAAAKNKATDIAKQVQGVTSVNNQLMVPPG